MRDRKVSHPVSAGKCLSIYVICFPKKSFKPSRVVCSSLILSGYRHECLKPQTFTSAPITVSVSAMPPCTQSFIPLPLPHEYNLNDMIASKRYESVWNTFLKELTRDSAVTLSSLQKKWHVNRSGMKQWMRDNGLSVKEAKKHIHECRHYAEEGQMLPLPATAGNLFLPMTTDQPALQPESCDILSGVSLVFPDGTQVNIRRGSAQAVMSFLKLYQREDLPCLD